MVDELLNSDIEPFVTLYHWDLPQALQEEGGWAKRDTVGYFKDYTEEAFLGLSSVKPSGSGKTTLISLTPRFYDVTKEFIAIDGYDIRKLKLS